MKGEVVRMRYACGCVEAFHLPLGAPADAAETLRVPSGPHWDYCPEGLHVSKNLVIEVDPVSVDAVVEHEILPGVWIYIGWDFYDGWYYRIEFATGDHLTDDGYRDAYSALGAAVDSLEERICTVM